MKEFLGKEIQFYDSDRRNIEIPACYVYTTSEGPTGLYGDIVAEREHFCRGRYDEDHPQRVCGWATITVGSWAVLGRKNRILEVVAREGFDFGELNEAEIREEVLDYFKGVK